MKYSLAKKAGLVIGPVLFLIFYNLPNMLISPAADKVIAVAVWMIAWWITEAVSISVTALIPLTIFPLLGIADIKSVAASYGSPIVFLFFGGFVMALALEKVNLHKRIALNIVQLTGTSPDRIILGFMMATAFLSMWISNTATTVVMLPIVASVINLLINDADGFSKNDRNFALSIMLGIAYAANVGGIATIIGTPPNTVIVGFMENEYDVSISFLNWMIMGLPFSMLMIAVVYFVLVKWVYPNKLGQLHGSRDIISEELKKLGTLKKREVQVLVIFLVTILLWISRGTLNELFPSLQLTDAGISMLAAFALFTIPFRFSVGDFILEWNDTVKLPWGILILFGGGLALASALSEANVIQFIGEWVASNKAFTTVMIAAVLVTLMVFMTELMSNVALVAIFAPVVAGIALGLDMEILHLLIPVAMASSCAFMLPMATPPNAIVFASGYIKVHEMARAGFVLNVVSIIVIMFFFGWVIPLLF